MNIDMSMNIDIDCIFAAIILVSIIFSLEIEMMAVFLCIYYIFLLISELKGGFSFYGGYVCGVIVTVDVWL